MVGGVEGTERTEGWGVSERRTPGDTTLILSYMSYMADTVGGGGEGGRQAAPRIRRTYMSRGKHWAVCIGRKATIQKKDANIQPPLLDVRAKENRPVRDKYEAGHAIREEVMCVCPSVKKLPK